jgi:hypothetical protein
MSTPVNALPDPEQQVPDAVVAEAPVTVSYEAIAAAVAEIEQVAKDAKAGLWSRTLRTLFQGVIAVVVLAVIGSVYNSLGQGVFDWKTLVFSAGQAAITAVVTYAHNKAAPAKN